MTATALRAAPVARVPTTEEVLAEHTPIPSGGYTCRACGHVYSDDAPVCPTALAAMAGHPEMGARLRVVQDHEVAPSDQLQVAYERLSARVDVLEHVDDADEPTPPPRWKVGLDLFGAGALAIVWSLITAVAFIYVYYLPGVPPNRAALLAAVTAAFGAAEAWDKWAQAARQVRDAWHLAQQPRPADRDNGSAPR